MWLDLKLHSKATEKVLLVRVFPLGSLPGLADSSVPEHREPIRLPCFFYFKSSWEKSISHTQLTFYFLAEMLSGGRAKSL